MPRHELLNSLLKNVITVHLFWELWKTSYNFF